MVIRFDIAAYGSFADLKVLGQLGYIHPGHRELHNLETPIPFGAIGLLELDFQFANGMFPLGLCINHNGSSLRAHSHSLDE